MDCFNATCLTPTAGFAPQTFSSALQFFAAATCLIKDNIIPNSPVDDFETFDFIIVGGGTAGCVVANRLSENKKWKILLLEAGGDPPVETKVPGLNIALLPTPYDWGYKTTYNGDTNRANKGDYINWPRAKVLGGCSNVNAMLYVRGNKHDFQEWYDAGNQEWHPNVVYKYYKKLESLQNMKLLKNPDVKRTYGINGPLIVNRFNSTKRPLAKKILSSWDEIGIKNVHDLNTANVLGSGIITATAYNGFRASSERMYLNPVKDRPNLKILKDTTVTKVLVNTIKKAAYGVEVETKDGTKKEYYATREVILSAGTINNVQVLMLSGIGPKEQLQKINIDCVVDLPAVGQNLQDHLIIPVTIFGNGPNETSVADKSLDAITYLHNHTGDLAENSFVTDILAFYSSDDNATYPYFQNHLTILERNSQQLQFTFSYIFNYEDSIVENIVNLNKKYTLYAFIFNLLHPLSRGNITLKSNDPKEHPLIYPNYFSNRKDLEAAVVGIKKLTKIIGTKFFESIGAFLGRMDWSPCNEFEIDSDDYWRCVCINMVYTIFHPVGTAKMGPDPLNSVVNSRLRVHNTKGLRIIDASVMPTITSGNTQAPTYMIAERGSDLVKEDHHYRDFI